MKASHESSVMSRPQMPPRVTFVGFHCSGTSCSVAAAERDFAAHLDALNAANLSYTAEVFRTSDMVIMTAEIAFSST